MTWEGRVSSEKVNKGIKGHEYGEEGRVTFGVGKQGVSSPYTPS